MIERDSTLVLCVNTSSSAYAIIIIIIIITFSDKNTALKVYEATDGTEYLTSASFSDLRFIPNDTEFEDKPRDECTSRPGIAQPSSSQMRYNIVRLSLLGMRSIRAGRKPSTKLSLVQEPRLMRMISAPTSAETPDPTRRRTLKLMLRRWTMRMCPKIDEERTR
jgi:hypothetical protein